jgi:hypothetical protein
MEQVAGILGSSLRLPGVTLGLCSNNQFSRLVVTVMEFETQVLRLCSEHTSDFQISTKKVDIGWSARVTLRQTVIFLLL